MSLDFELYIQVDTGGKEPYRPTLFERNITHNLGKMWVHAGCWDALYESEGKTAAEVLPTLRLARDDLYARPDYYKQFDAPNGWGTWEHATDFLDDVVAACEQHPKALISVSR